MCICCLSSSPFPGLTVNADPILMSNSEFDAFGLLLFRELTSIAIDIHPMDLNHCHYEEVCMSVKRIANTTFPLCNIQIGRVSSLMTLIGAQNLDYLNEMIATTWCVECSPRII